MMFFFYGAVEIREAFREDDECEEKLRIAQDLAREKCKSAADGLNYFMALNTMNGASTLLFSGNLGKEDGRWADFIDFIEQLIKIAPGSFGHIFYINDEAANDPGEVDLRGFAISKGGMVHFIETNLSPFYSKVEEI